MPPANLDNLRTELTEKTTRLEQVNNREFQSLSAAVNPVPAEGFLKTYSVM